jgi:hypothetical protein
MGEDEGMPAFKKAIRERFFMHEFSPLKLLLKGNLLFVAACTFLLKRWMKKKENDQ